MTPPVVDYRKFRLSKLNTPEFSHLWLLFTWIPYFAVHWILEKCIPAESCHAIYSPLDDLIPFCELFFIPYAGWFLLVYGSLFYFLFYDIPSFKKLQTYILITQIVASLVYIFYPSRQDLRPDLDTLGRENLLTFFMGLIYKADTNTGVFPSLHVAYSLGIASVWCKAKGASRGWKTFVVVFVILICLSIAFVKQHSILDAFGALAMCIPIELILYWNYWKERRKKPAAIA